MTTTSIFTKEGIYITKNGYFKSKWNSDKKSYEAFLLSSRDIEKHLSSLIYLDDDVRIKHIFEPIWNSDIFAIIFYANFWVEMMEELKNLDHPKWIGDTKKRMKADGSDIEYLEVYQVNSLDSKEKKLQNNTAHWDFHGIGYPIKTEKFFEKYYSKIGARISFAIEFNSLANYMNFPIKIGKVSYFDKAKQNKELFCGDGHISLYELLHSITWEMSFSGVGKKRDQFLKKIKKQEKKVKKIKK